MILMKLVSITHFSRLFVRFACRLTIYIYSYHVSCVMGMCTYMSPVVLNRFTSVAFSMWYAGASIKSYNDSPWGTLSLRLSRPISAPLQPAVLSWRCEEDVFCACVV